MKYKLNNNKVLTIGGNALLYINSKNEREIHILLGMYNLNEFNNFGHSIFNLKSNKWYYKVSKMPKCKLFLFFYFYFLFVFVIFYFVYYL